MTDTASQEDGKRALLDGIGADAGSEAAALIKKAEVEAAQRIKNAQTQAATILEEAHRKAQAAARGIERQAEQTAAVEIRRIALKVREQASRRVLEEAAGRLERMTGELGYRDTLKGWIVEAALGLRASEAMVLATAAEMALIDDGLLAETSAEVSRIAGTPVRLTRSKDWPTNHQGVVLTSADRRTAFNNQVVTRLERYQSEIRKLVYGTLRRAAGE